MKAAICLMTADCFSVAADSVCASTETNLLEILTAFERLTMFWMSPLRLCIVAATSLDCTDTSSASVTIVLND